MKMIKQGVDPKTKLLDATCRNCQSEYEFTICDPTIQTTRGDQRDPSYKWFPCQLCNSQVYVREN